MPPLSPSVTRCGSVDILAGQNIGSAPDGTNAKEGALAGVLNGRTRIISLTFRAFGNTNKTFLKVYRGTASGPKHLIIPYVSIPEIVVDYDNLIFPFFFGFTTQIRLFSPDWKLWYQLHSNPGSTIQIVEEAMDWE